MDPRRGGGGGSGAARQAGLKLLGTLKKQLNSSIKKLITYELNKNLAKLSAAQIRSYLPKYLTQPKL